MTYKQEIHASIVETVLRVEVMNDFLLKTHALYESGSISYEEFDLVLATTLPLSEQLHYEGEMLLIINDALFSSDVE
jgi:hypothetical protein